MSTMLGWDLAAYRGATNINVKYPYVEGGEEILYIEPTPNIGLHAPVRDVALETLNASGYPYIYRMRAGDFPHDELGVHKLDVPDDEIVIVEMWDQS